MIRVREVLLEARELFVRYGERVVIDGVSLSLFPGEITALLGPNGSGKSTLLAALAGVGRRDGGSVKLLGDELSTLSRRKASTRVAVVPQQTGFGMPFSVLQTVMMGRFPSAGRFGRLISQDEKLALEAMGEVDLMGFEDRPVTELSGGEAQRVALARSLAQQTPLLLLDEPTSALDPKHAIAVFDLLRRLRQKNMSILVALHDVNLALRFADRVLFLRGGNIEEAPTPEKVNGDVLARIFDIEWKVEQLAGGIRVAFPEGRALC